MKKLLYIALCSLAICLSTKAQEINKGISVNDATTTLSGGMLDIQFILKASDMRLNCDGQLKLEFAIENDDRKLVLPPVIYSGTRRYRYERRKELLSGAYVAEPYHIYKGVKKNKSYELDYKISVPFYSWMKDANITCTQYIHDCSGDNKLAEAVLIPNLIPTPIHTKPAIWAPDSTIFRNLVAFLIPEVEEVKARASMIELNIGFPVNVTEVRPAFGNNRNELRRADSLVTMLQNNDLLTINNVFIKGYASPEGSYAVNERLARGRSESFKQYLVRMHPANQYVRNANTSWIAEDWEGFGRLVEQYDIPAKAEVLAIVNDNSIAPDAKDLKLQRIVWWSANYKIILKEMYPKLRRIELKVDYTVSKLSDSQARELLYTNPDMLSLEEIFRVARYYEPGSRQYREVYEIAARQFPNNVVANNNAAAALLQEGNTQAALPYLEKTKKDDISLINYGAYHYINSDLDKAVDYFKQANEAGIEQATHNLQLVNPGLNK